MSLQLRPYQREAIDALYAWFHEKTGNPTIVMPTGCHAAGTGILMYDGSVKAVENVAVGDHLMGPDSCPRQVLQLAHGRETMYRITPKKGDPFVVNAGHVLSLKTTNEGKIHACTATGKEVDNVTVQDWLGKSKSWRHLRKLRRVAVDFPVTKEPPLDPWCLGVLLGDGCLATRISICNPDFEVLREFDDKMTALGLVYRWSQKPNNKAYDVHFSDPEANRTRPNRVMAILRHLGIAGCSASQKFVPNVYKRGSRNTRLEVLAGLIDTDGHYDGKLFDFISKSRKLAEDVVFICRSLGLWAKLSECRKYCQTGNGGTYWRVPISGDIDMVPTRVVRKQAKPRKQKKNPLVTGFTVEPLGEGDFFGFSLDGDHLYLTADFTVHHNSGKSVVMATFIREALELYPPTRILVVTHVRELISQNHAELLTVWPEAPAGIHSAGLKARDVESQVLFCGIQSVHKRAYDIQRCDLVLVDEAHLIPRKSDTMYQRFLEDLKKINPYLKIIGFTATPYRLDSGLLHKGKDALFNDIAFDVSVRDLIDQGYLCPLVSKRTDTQLDVTGVGVRGGEFIAGQLEAAVDQDPITRAAVEEIIAFGQERRSWLLFCAGVGHAEHLRDAVREHGFTCEGIFGHTPREERDAIIAAFKRGEIRALAAMNVLTTGFNAPGVDLIAMLRPTQSTGLYVQIAGRGTRLFPGKENCLVLDFAGNVARHGPIDLVKPKNKRENGDGDAPVKACPECRTINHAAIRTCTECGFAFPPPEVQIDTTASTEEILSSTKVEWVRVFDIAYHHHQKEGKPPSMRVEYLCGLTTHREWVCFEHTGYARQKAAAWWSRRTPPGTPMPKTVDEALDQQDLLRIPDTIAIRRSGRFTEVVNIKFEETSHDRSHAA